MNRLEEELLLLISNDGSHGAQSDSIIHWAAAGKAIVNAGSAATFCLLTISMTAKNIVFLLRRRARHVGAHGILLERSWSAQPTATA